ncbi:MAG: hypothetical protein KDC05_16215 [Bacteroidales bacterium]|nr:hypothetical protein [Bacteroidales bacterium]
MKILLALFLFISLFVSYNFAQTADFESTLDDENLLIKSDSFLVDFHGQKLWSINVTVDRTVHYKILTAEGKRTLSKLILPQSFDPLYKPHNSSIRNPQRLYDELTITDFTVERLNSNSQQPIAVNRKVEQIRMVSDKDRFVYPERFVYSIDGLEVGDEVRIHYHYFFPYYKNYLLMMSNRFFFHGNEPKEKMFMALSHHAYLEADTNSINGAFPTVETNDNIITYRWQYNNLTGCLDEPGSRPYLELPWFSFTPKPYDLLYQDYNSFREDFIPMWFFLGYSRESKIRTGIINNDLGINTKDNIKFRKLAERYTSTLSDDSSGMMAIRNFQRYVIDSTQYKNDFDLFNNMRNYEKDHPGIELFGGVVREHNKENIYSNMIPKLAYSFFTAYGTDKRTGEMSKNYYAPMLDNELLFCPILHNDAISFLMPKTDLRNLYAEELPFYYENIPLIVIFTFDYAGYKRNFNEILRLINTPASSMKDNSRKVNSMVSIDLNNLTSTFNTKVSLSGQYSTLTRCIYLGDACDSTIHPGYMKSPWEIKGNTTLTHLNADRAEHFFPFRFTANATYNDSSVISKRNGHYTIDLSGWVNHVIFADLIEGSRYTDFYPDFTGSDSWAYMISFNEPLEIVEEPEVFQVENEFGRFVFNIKQTGEKQLLINSYFATESHKVESADIQKVKDIYKAILKSGECKLIIRSKEG